MRETDIGAKTDFGAKSDTGARNRGGRVRKLKWWARYVLQVAVCVHEGSRCDQMVRKLT